MLGRQEAAVTQSPPAQAEERRRHCTGHLGATLVHDWRPNAQRRRPAILNLM